MATADQLRELARTAQALEGRPDARISLMLERWTGVDEPDPRRVRLFRTSGSWGEVGRRWLRYWQVRFRADEVLQALDKYFPERV